MNPTTPTISIAMATYNGGKYLREQLRSLLEQTYQPFELIACDDGSTDDTLQILDAFSATAPFRVTVRRNERRMGPWENFLGAMKLCTGDYIACCDQDDIWPAHKLQRCAEVLRKRPSALLMHNARTFSAAPGYVESTAGPFIKAGLYGPNETPGMNWPQGIRSVIRNDLFRRFDSSARPAALYEYDRAGARMYHDEYLYQICRGHMIEMLEDDLVLYRQHESNVTGTHRTDAGYTASLRAMTGSPQYVQRSRYFADMAAFCRSQSSDPQILGLARNCEALAALYGARARVHDPELGRGARAAALLELLKIKLTNGIPWLEYGGKSFAKDAASLLKSPRALVPQAKS